MNSKRSNKENAMVSRSNNVMPDPDKVTDFMRKSLEQLQTSLICPLCNQMLKEPSTLACAHTFCREVKFYRQRIVCASCTKTHLLKNCIAVFFISASRLIAATILCAQVSGHCRKSINQAHAAKLITTSQNIIFISKSKAAEYPCQLLAPEKAHS